MKPQQVILIVLFLKFSFKGIESQRNNFDLTFDDVFDAAKQIRLKQLFDRLKRALTPEIIQKVEQYEKSKIEAEGDPLEKKIRMTIQDEGRVGEILFFVKILSLIIKPLSKNFNITSIDHIVEVISEKMQRIYNVYPDTYGKLQSFDWLFVTALLFGKYDTFLIDAQNQFQYFTYNQNDRNLLRNLFEFFVAIISKKYKFLYSQKEAPDLLSTNKVEGSKTLDTDQTSVQRSLQIRNNDHFATTTTEKGEFQAVDQDSPKSYPTENVSCGGKSLISRLMKIVRSILPAIIYILFGDVAS